MIKKYPKKLPHGIMFHYFHDDKHHLAQGSISQEDFEDILQFIGLKRILSPDEWVRRLNIGELKPEDVCLTFDHGLLCQFDVALPVMEKYNLKAFWFVYSSPFEGGLCKREIYRIFQSKFFSNIDEFYQAFFDRIFNSKFADKAHGVLKEDDIRQYKKIFQFYSDNDVKFRFIRDRAMTKSEFEEFMYPMIVDYGTSLAELSKNLWLSNEHLKYLTKRGHSVGLHSYSHPMILVNLSPEEQWEEYSKNYNHIKRVTTQSPTAVSHPNNSYNEDTLEVLSRLDISCGFMSNMFPQHAGSQLNRSKYEIAREDHSNIMKMKSASSTS